MMVSQQQQHTQMMGGAAAAMKAKSKADANINLVAVQRVDPCAIAIIDQATQTALYKFNQEHHQWEKTDIEGSMFVYQRADKPWYSLLIANRQSPADLIEPLSADLQFKLHTPYLLMCKPDGTINGLWFYDRLDCDRMAVQLNRLVADQDGLMRAPPTPNRPSSASTSSGGVGVLDLLSKAQSEYGKTATSAVPNVVRPKPVKASGAVTPQESGTMPAMLQKLFSEKKPEQQPSPSAPAVRKGTLSAEELEKELQSKPVEKAAAIAKSTPMRLDTCAPMFQFAGSSGSPSPDVKSINSLAAHPMFLSSSNTLTNHLSMASMQGSTMFSTNETSTPRQSGDTDPLLLDEMRSAAAELSLDDSLVFPAVSSEQLLRPADLMSRPSMSVSSLTNGGGLRLGASAFTMENDQPSSVCGPSGMPSINPLTKDQMIQGFMHLLKTDAQFVSKLHQAYVESLNMGLSFGR